MKKSMERGERERTILLMDLMFASVFWLRIFEIFLYIFTFVKKFSRFNLGKERRLSSELNAFNVQMSL